MASDLVPVPVPPEEPAEGRNSWRDPELLAAQRMQRLLDDVEPGGKRRLLLYLLDRNCGLAPTVAPSQFTAP